MFRLRILRMISRGICCRVVKSLTAVEEPVQSCSCWVLLEYNLKCRVVFL